MRKTLMAGLILAAGCTFSLFGGSPPLGKKIASESGIDLRVEALPWYLDEAIWIPVLTGVLGVSGGIWARKHNRKGPGSA